MKRAIKKIIRIPCRLADVLLSPAIFISASLMFFIRRIGITRMPISRKIFNFIGIFPIRDVYYEPLFNSNRLTRPLNVDRSLPGLDMNIDFQLDLLSKFDYSHELERFPSKKNSPLKYYYGNNNFESGDAEYLYNIVRHFKPKSMIEIGSGFSTLMAREAIEQNGRDDPDYSCKHTCIEPYRMPWLEKLDIEIVRDLVEHVDISIFDSLSENDILFIDSSHIIRPQGDVLFEFLELLPQLKKGVIIHVHDVFTPRDYIESFVIDNVYLWNEQYLMEAFLSCNNQFRIIGAVNFLMRHHPEALFDKCPVLKREASFRNPGSFWFQKIA